MLKFIGGRATTEQPRAGTEGKVVVRFSDVFDQVSIDRINHSSHCAWCRRLWSTLQYQRKFSADHVWPALVAEFLKLLASTGVQSKFGLGPDPMK